MSRAVRINDATHEVEIDRRPDGTVEVSLLFAGDAYYGEPQVLADLFRRIGNDLQAIADRAAPTLVREPGVGWVVMLRTAGDLDGAAVPAVRVITPGPTIGVHDDEFTVVSLIPKGD